MQRRRPSPVDERTGLIRWVFDVPVDPGEPRLFNASVKMADTYRYSGRSCYDNNGGSGLTRDAARNAAIGEGLERYCCSIFDPETFVFGTARELSHDRRVADPDSFALFHPDQTRPVPPFDADTPVAWVRGYSLVHNEPTLVPACVVFMPYFPCFKERGEQVIGPGVSTGMACAASRDEALLKGICESVERDAFMIAWYNRLSLPRVDVRSHPKLRALYEQRLERDGLRYLLFDMTTDIVLPSFACVLIDDRRDPPMISVGGATSVDPVAAASKALLEAVQTREWGKYLGTSGKPFHFEPDFSDIRDFEDHVKLYAYGGMTSAIRFLTEDSAEAPADWNGAATGDATRDLQTAVGALARLGLDAIALDLTTPDVAECGLVVTRVLAPALQPLDADYRYRFLGGRRLYEVPRAMGYRDGVSTIQSLNPYPHPYP